MDRGRCVTCRKHKGGWRSDAAGGFVCRACYRKHFQPRETCGCCGRDNQLINARPEGIAYCEACYKSEINRARCAYCSKRRTVHARDPHNRPVCMLCFEAHMKPLEPCMYCHEDKVPAYRGPRGEGICRRCYHRDVNHAPCDACGNDLPIAARTGTRKATFSLGFSGIDIPHT